MIRILTALTMAFTLATACAAEDYQLLRAKVELLVEQAKTFSDDSFRRGSDVYGPQFQYYFGLMYATGTNLLGRAESAASTQRLKKYYALIEKDYAAYSKVEAATEKAAATGSDRVWVGRHTVVNNGNRHRAKRLINAEKLGEKELAEAIKRWETFALQVKKDPVKK